MLFFAGEKARSTAKTCCAQIVQVLNTQIFCTFHVHCAMYIVFIHCFIYIYMLYSSYYYNVESCDEGILQDGTFYSFVIFVLAFHFQ